MLSPGGGVHPIAYGPVDTEVLRHLQDSFDTREILRIVDLVDTIRARLCEPEGIRDDLLQLHGMAHTVLNGASLVLGATNPTLVEQAETTALYRRARRLPCPAIGAVAP
ncbi:Tn3 family transposase post-transcriptional regulator TnpC [Cupriavidus lacunae]|uniref:Tn3 family transposase post-transcriptional regulator TnpC n=1 Tax=Cupriavidus lacunae TaxID=2666307 RepID=UPI002449F710|nr:Tn3 family transposase post-transcriptional regulator TnpC [Cupriavidus lacunae]